MSIFDDARWLDVGGQHVTPDPIDPPNVEVAPVRHLTGVIPVGWRVTLWGSGEGEVIGHTPDGWGTIVRFDREAPAMRQIKSTELSVATS